MSHKWLTFLTIGFLTMVVMVFFWYRVQPLKIDREAIAEKFEVVTEPTITFVNPSKGAENPSITILEYSDFQCNACASLATSLDEVIAAYPNDVQVVWKDLPNESIHDLATPAAIAAHCADRQGKFWEYHEEVYARQSYLNESVLSQIATDLELDTEKFANCLSTNDTLPIVKKDFEEAMGLGLTSTPTLFIDDDVYVGAISTKEILDIIAKKLETLE
jgi:protein-disulfide isomerase